MRFKKTLDKNPFFSFNSDIKPLFDKFLFILFNEPPLYIVLYKEEFTMVYNIYILENKYNLK